MHHTEEEAASRQTPQSGKLSRARIAGRRQKGGGGAVLACALSAAMLISACGGSTSNGGTGSGGSTGGSGGGSNTTLTVGEVSAPGPLGPVGGGDIMNMNTLPYGGILHWSSTGTAEPGLATSWHYVTVAGQPNENFEFTLRHDARFSDGTPVTAQAVKNWFDYVIKTPKAQTVAASDGGPMSSARTIGKWTVEVHYKAPNPLIEYQLAGANPGYGLVASPKCVATPSLLDSGDCGAGPYMLDGSSTVTGSSYTFKQNPYYYDKSQTRWKSIVLKIIPTASSMLEAMRTGEIQVAQGDPSTAAAAKSAGYTVVSAPSYNDGLMLNLKAKGVSPALSSLQVRQAMNYAVNRNQLAKVFGGQATDELDTYHGISPAYQNYYSYNLAKAKSLMAAAGYSKGFTMNAVTYGPLGSQGTPQIEAVASQLAALNIKVNVHPAASLGAWSTAITPYPDANEGPWGADFMPIYYGIFMTGAFGWKDPTIDKLEAKSISAPPAAASSYWQQISAEAVKQAYFLPTIIADQNWYLAPHKVNNFSATIAYHLLNPVQWTPAG